MNHISEFSTPPSKNALVDSLVSDKLDSLQDIIIGMSSVQEDKIDKLSTNFAHMEDQLREQVLDLKHKLLESKNREEELLEQMKRRIGDISSISSSLNYKIDKCLAQEKSKSYEPQVHKSYEHQVHNAPQSHEELNLHYNNPFMNQHSLHIHPEKQDFKHQKFSSSKTEIRHGAPPPPLPNDNVPQWQVDFPFINQDHIDAEMRKELWKSIPKTSEWEKFSGELPYNHELWLKNIDVFVQDYCMLDHMIISRLTALFTDTAKNWYIGIRDSHENRS
jgi:hypothetical protein